LKLLTSIGILAVFAMTLSMVVLLPARADPLPIVGTSVETQWVPSGPAADQIQYSVFAGATGEFNALQAGQIDLTDIAVPLARQANFCPAGTGFWCTGTGVNAGNPPAMAYLQGWIGISDISGVGIAQGNFWSLLNGWNSGPAVSGPTIRWGLSAGTSSLNPFLSTLSSEQDVLQEVYDPLIASGPYLSGGAPQVIGYMANTFSTVTHTSDPNCPVTIGITTVAACVKINLRGDIFFQDGVQVTASDVKFSYENFKAKGGIGSFGSLNTVDIVFDPRVLPAAIGGTEAPGQAENLYVALSAATATALLDLTTVPIIPQHIWKTIGAAGACADTSITNPGSGLGTPPCTVEPTFLAGAGADPVANNRLIGSGPYICGVRNIAADPASGFAVLGGGCTSSGMDAVPAGLITLYRYGTGLSHLAGSYFRNNAKYKEFAWAHTSSGNAVNIFDVSTISGCFTNQGGALCPHYRSPDTVLMLTNAGPFIGAVSGGSGGALTGLQKAEVVQWFATSWTDPIAYSSLVGVLPAPATLYEDGSQYS
jgi:hypothetical protein